MDVTRRAVHVDLCGGFSHSSVVRRRHEMAKFLWERGDKCISSALAASQLYLSMAERVKQFDLDLKEQFMKNKE